MKQTSKTFKAFSALAVLTLLSLSLVMAGSTYSIRAEDGFLNRLNGETSFSDANVRFSGYIPLDNAVRGQGTVTIRATTTSGERESLYLSFDNSVVDLDTGSTLRVTSDASYYDRSTRQRVEGKLTYQLNKNTNTLVLIGHSGLDLRVNDMRATVLVR